jgi:hypothetical protein
MRLVSRLAGLAAVALYLLLCLRWFSVADTVRPGWLSALAPGLIAGAALGAAALWLLTRRRPKGVAPRLAAGGEGSDPKQVVGRGDETADAIEKTETTGGNATAAGPLAVDPAGPQARRPFGLIGRPSEVSRALLFVLAVTAAFRLPVVFQGAAGAVTPDGALSGIVALHVRDGIDRHVFVPMVPYSGSLKSHLTAPLALLLDPAVAFALASMLFYLAFVAATCLLASSAGREAGLDERGALHLLLASGLYLAFSPPYLTRYSLSNDGNYVEVLGLGTWALLLAVRLVGDQTLRPLAALGTGILLGLAFWCHILAVIPTAAVGVVLLSGCGLRVFRVLPPLALGWVLGYAPGLLWNSLSDWGSFRYILPASLGGETVPMGQELAVPFWPRLAGLFTDQLPFLLGYDPGHVPAVDALLRAYSWGLTALVVAALVLAVRRFGIGRPGAGRALLVLAGVNLAVAFLALPQIPGNPRYLQPAMATVAVMLALLLRGRRARVLLALIVVVGALFSTSQMMGAVEKDAKWRSFVADLERLGVRHCYTDFFLATNVNFFSEERVVCTSKLGPTMTEYFFEYRDRVEKAGDAAFVAVNRTAAKRLEDRLTALGVRYERTDLMKPVLHHLSRKVDPEELFPGREFPRR